MTGSQEAATTSDHHSMILPVSLSGREFFLRSWVKFSASRWNSSGDVPTTGHHVSSRVDRFRNDRFRNRCNKVQQGNCPYRVRTGCMLVNMRVCRGAKVARLNEPSCFYIGRLHSSLVFVNGPKTHSAKESPCHVQRDPLVTSCLPGVSSSPPIITSLCAQVPENSLEGRERVHGGVCGDRS